MKLTIFSKKRTSHDGRQFDTFLTKLTKKDGTEITTGVKFRELCGSPRYEDCPCIIEVDKSKMNFNTKEISQELNDGTERVFEQNTLWISEWKMSNEKYVDTSMDDFI